MNINYYKRLEEINNNPNIDVLLDQLSTEYLNYQTRLEIIDHIKKILKK